MLSDFNLSDLYLLKNAGLKKKKIVFCKIYREQNLDNCLVVVVVDAYIILCFYFPVHFKWRAGPLHKPVAFWLHS